MNGEAATAHVRQDVVGIRSRRRRGTDADGLLLFVEEELDILGAGEHRVCGLIQPNSSLRLDGGGRGVFGVAPLLRIQDVRHSLSSASRRPGRDAHANQHYEHLGVGRWDISQRLSWGICPPSCGRSGSSHNHRAHVLHGTQILGWVMRRQKLGNPARLKQEPRLFQKGPFVRRAVSVTALCPQWSFRAIIVA